jgi:hypothetical protein
MDRQARKLQTHREDPSTVDETSHELSDDEEKEVGYP